MAKALQVEIVTPEKQYTFEQAASFFAPGAFGYFEILPDHAPYMVKIEIGELIVKDTDGNEHVFSTAGGICEVKNNVVRLLTNAAERVDEIDVERALKAKERAEKRLTEKKPGTDFDRAKIALMRAINRIKIVEKYKN